MDRQGQLADKIAGLLASENLYVDELLDPLVFLVSDVMAQMTERQYDPSFFHDVSELIRGAYEFRCSCDRANATFN